MVRSPRISDHVLYFDDRGFMRAAIVTNAWPNEFGPGKVGCNLVAFSDLTNEATTTRVYSVPHFSNAYRRYWLWPEELYAA
jgi:hypothetical protein